MKILHGYPYYPANNTYGNVEKINLNYLQRLREGGIDIEGFCLTIDPPNECLSFKDLDSRWKNGDRKLLSLYEKLLKALEGKDVFFNAAGINLHPEFVETLPLITVFGCNDDPENSHNLSKPAAHAYDLCLIGNIAEIESYKSWGIRNVEWLPLGLMPNMYDHSLTYDKIVNGIRDIDLFMIIDKLSPWRKGKMIKMEAAFPDAHFYGKGWIRGYISRNDDLNFLGRSKIGPNFHNSSGPINSRTYYLPANGVMQICDNKSYLGKIYKLNNEVVGFDTVEECIDLCRYYLAHDNERRIIAAAGWKRAIEDYNELSVFKRAISAIESIKENKPVKVRKDTPENLINVKKRNYMNYLIYICIKYLKQQFHRINYYSSRFMKWLDRK